MKPINPEKVLAFITRHLKDTPKDVYLLPWGPTVRIATFTAPGARFIGSYTRDVAVSQLHEDALCTQQEIA